MAILGLILIIAFIYESGTVIPRYKVTTDLKKQLEERRVEAKKHVLVLEDYSGGVDTSNVSINFDTLLHQHEVLPNFIIVTVANIGFLNFTLNWVESMRRNVHNTDKYLVACLDMILYKELQSRNIPSFLVPAALKAIQTQEKWKPYQFGSLEYNKATLAKIAIVFNILDRYNYSVLFTDADTAWMDPLIPTYFYSRLHGPKDFYDIYMSRDDINRPKYGCTGLYAIRSTDFAKKLWKRIASYSPETNDQWLLSLFYETLQERSKIGFAPLTLFHNGQVLLQKLAKTSQTEPWFYHANFKIKQRYKEDLLRKAGAWYLD